jgi:hypothetical protein
VTTVDGGAAPTDPWGDLTARSVALCRRDLERWRECAALSDRLEREGWDAPTAVRLALERYGA